MLPYYTCIQKFALLLVLFCALLALSQSMTFAQAAVTSGAGTGSANSVVPIGSNDSLNVTVIGESDLSNTYLVDANGDISMPFAGKIHVGGLSVDDATTLIQAKLAQIYTSPQVTVVRPSLGGISVYVTGSVAKQGDCQVRRDAHLNDIIQTCMPTPDADLMHVQITSGEPGQPHSTSTYDLTTFLDAGSSDGNPALNDGDQVFVPKRTIESVSIVGFVAKPGRYDVQPGETVFQLISDAGGLTPAADPTGTYLKEMGSETQYPFNYTTAAQNPADTQLNPVLKDGDEVVVPLTSTQPTYALLGAVLKPGEYQLHGKTSLLDAIANAGGLEDRAQAKKTTITRMSAAGPTVTVMDANDTKKAALFYLQAGDNITIPHGGGGNQLNIMSALTVVSTVLGIMRL